MHDHNHHYFHNHHDRRHNHDVSSMSLIKLFLVIILNLIITSIVGKQ